ncbi:MAG TPA: HAMP domain-containing sensor histidine kinase [Symbiobacteriaceae bacterium]|nr:HAMP domain-containing sensor histidine kinase [Symbiobacteriaceae bacterium]
MRRLQTRLIATYVALALVLLVATGLLFSTLFTNYAEWVQEQRVNDAIRQAKAVIAVAQASPDLLVSELTRQFPELVFTFQPATIVTRTPDPTQSPDVLRFWGLILPRPKESSTYAVVYQIGPVPVGSIFIQPKEGSGLLFRTFYREIALLVAMGIGLAALLGWWFSRWLARPITNLTAATAAVAEGDFLQTVAPTGTPELDALVQQFNRMVQRLDESFRSLSAERDVARRFASDAAHELKTPLTALKTYYETAADRPERIPQALKGMGRSIERIDGIITGLLQLSRLGAGTGLELTTADAAEALRDLEPTYRMMARDAGHTWESAGLNQPLPVRLDPRLFEIALTNLVANACKFTPAGGQVRLDAWRSGREAVIAVSDNGPGITPEEQAHIFERFFRGTSTQTIPGSGLGLSIVAEAVARMGGRVTVDSKVGAGSRFAIYLPLEDQLPAE